MRILFLTQVLPYPPNAGPRIKTWNVLRFLAERGHQVTLVSYVRPEEREYIPYVERHVHRLVTVPIQRSKWADARAALLSLAKNRPFLVERDDQPEMRRSVALEIASGQMDAIHADQVTMTQFAFGFPGLFRVFDAHNATWAIIDGARAGQASWLRPFLAVETRAMRRYEGRVLNSFDVTLAVTEADHRDLKCAVTSGGGTKASGRSRIEVIPITVDTERLRPRESVPETCEILAYGSMHYAPNAEGIAWFMEKVLPMVLAEIPVARMKVVGKSPPQRIRKLAGSAGGSIEVTGYVDDLEPYFSQASVVVVPVLSGSGMRVRILEAMARGMPIVTTSLGAQGIAVDDGKSALIADQPGEFAAAVVRLLRDQQLQTSLATNGRKLAVDRYHWATALKPLDDIYPPPGAAALLAQQGQ